MKSPIGKRFAFSKLEMADLVIDAVYEGGPHKDLRSEPIHQCCASWMLLGQWAGCDALGRTKQGGEYGG